MLSADDDLDEPEFQRLWVICDNAKVYQVGNGVDQNEATYTIVEEYDWSGRDLEEIMA